MKIYLAAAENETFAKALSLAHAPRWLYSFFYLDREKVRYPKDVEIFLDSGGYSARVQGVDIDIQEYIDYVKRLRRRAQVVANLDTGSVEESQCNLKRMLAARLEVLPIWHVRWPFSVFKEYCQDFDYVAIGGVAGTREDRLSDKKIVGMMLPAVKYAYGRKVRLHWFGGTHTRILKQLPIYSTDSTTWISGGKWGQVFIFDQGRLLSFSYRQREAVKKHVRALNYPLNEIMTSYRMRDLQNVRAFLQMEEWLTELWKRRGVSWDEDDN